MVTTRASADKAARWRERNRERLAREARLRREREREREVAGRCCCCCACATLGFLVLRGGEVRCRNCDHMLRTYGYCSHHGLSRTLA